jgi:signal transduction histidine kinase
VRAAADGYIRCTVQRRAQHLLDALVPLVTAGIIVAVLLHDGDARAAELLVGVAAAAALAFRRRAPAATLAVSGALVLVLLHLSPAAGAAAVIAPAVALYSLALRRGPRERALAAAAAVVAVIAADALHGGRPTLLQTLGHLGLIAIPLLIADLHRTRHANLALLQQRHAGQERLRIARDLHDVVAHTLTTINVQAATAAELLDRDPAHARAALETIEDASRDAIGELRAIVGVLRADTDAPLAPAPGIEQLDDLVARARADGVAIDLSIAGDPPSRLPEAVSLAAFRIAQESLTNACRHAAGARVRIALAYQPDAVGLVVENLASAVGGSPIGAGIMGMRERAAALGGTFAAGPTEDSFRVETRLPYR